MLNVVAFSILVSTIFAHKTNSSILKVVSVILSMCFLKSSVLVIPFCLLGLFISPVVLFLSSIMTYHQFPVLPKRMLLSPNIITDAMYEEIVWRDLVLFFLFDEIEGYERKTIVIGMCSLMFVFIHNKIKKINRKSLEMLIFTVVLYVGAIVAPGVHYGLHVGRNVYIYSTSKGGGFMSQKRKREQQFTSTQVGDEEYSEVYQKSIWFSPIQISHCANARMIFCCDIPVLMINYTIQHRLAVMSLTVFAKDSLPDALCYAIDEMIMVSPEISHIIIYLLDSSDSEFLQNNCYHFSMAGCDRNGIRIDDQLYDLLIYQADLPRQDIESLDDN